MSAVASLEPADMNSRIVSRDIRVPADLKGVKEPPEASGAPETRLAIPFHGRAEIRTTQL